jgi:hypothetical protein
MVRQLKVVIELLAAYSSLRSDIVSPGEKFRILVSVADDFGVAHQFHADIEEASAILVPSHFDGLFASDQGKKETRDKLRRLLPCNIFVQILAGPPELRTGFFGFMLKFIALATLIALPVLVLLLLQIQFLPFLFSSILFRLLTP